MENTQVSKLKINVNNIKSFLFKSNKELISLKKERLKLTFTQEERRKLSKKEDSSESQGSFVQSVKNIGKRLISGPLSFIDKFKEFFGLILLGIVVNNLPAIVQKLQDVFTKIQTFLDQNPWIMDAVKFGFKMIGQGIMGLAKFIRFIGPYIGGSFKFALDTLKSARIQVEGLISTFVDLNSSFGKLAKDLNIDKIPDASKDPSRYSNFIAGGGKKALEEKGLSVDEVVEQGKKNISRYDSGPRSPQPQPQPEKPAQKLARGGTVGNIPPQEGTGRGGPSDIAKKKSSTTTTRSPFTKTESGGARRARESVNYFETFNKTLNETKENTILEKKNIGSFEEMTNNFKQFSELMQKLSILSPRRQPPQGPPGEEDDGSIVIDGKTYTAEGGELPNQDKFFTSGFGMRDTGIPGASTDHRGVDFAHPIANIPISVIRPGTVSYAGVAGNAGKYVEITHPNGVKTGYGHLSSIRVRKDQIISPGTVIGNQGMTGVASGPHVHFNYIPLGGGLSNGRNFANSYFRFGGNVRIKEAPVMNLPTQSSASGKASWYGPGFEGNKTSQGDIYNSNEYTAAIQQNLRDQFGVSLGSGKRGYARVTNTSTGKSIYVKINDVGPLTPGRVIDLSKKSFRALDPNGNPDSTGVLSNIKVEYLGEYKSGYPLGPINLTPASRPTPRNAGNPVGGMMNQLLDALQGGNNASLISLPTTKELASLPTSTSGSSNSRDVILVRQQTIVKDTAFIPIPT